MNGPRLRSSQGCWTCRLRRKKCDEARPVCVACGGLEIDCHYSDTKPEWMDGGAREKRKADELKVMVKQKATERRERKWGQLPTMADFSPSAQEQEQKQREQEEQAQAQAPAQEHQSPDHLMSDVGGLTLSDAGSGSGSGDRTPPSTAPGSTPPSQTEEPSNTSSGSSPSSWGGQVRPAVDSFPENRSELEVSYTMIYLDYVVPFLFPFYRPCLLESSRGWMLVLLMKNRALFHTALSLANWLYAVLLDSTDGTHGACKRANWAELQAHEEIAIQALQADVRALNERGGVAGAFRECVACIQSITQLLLFEVATANTANWPAHHDAAVALFDQLVSHYAAATDRDGRATTPWASILDRIGLPFRRIPLPSGRQILTSDQSAYQFYTAYLLWIDIVAATTNGEAPRLRAYHAELLQGDSPRLCLGEYVGCHSWAMLEIAEVAQLAAWKRAQQATGSLSMVDLVRQHCAIEKRLRQRIETLEVTLSSLSSSSGLAVRASNVYDPSAYHPITPYSGFHEMVAECETHKTPAIDLHTRIWAQAAITYLHVIASGLQPTLPEIQASVQLTMDLFRALPSPLALRTLIWPFAVTGCLAATPEQESFFVGLVDSMGAMQVFGTVKEALNIMQLVWGHRDSGCIVDPQMWDIATCFSLLGHRSLLV
ncbi:fungal-specific transcription factor domain-containing protein [Nemania abortiva]|nr:fungal-specific transcription factor domain-containing protein [Nemania abortiva]